MTQTVDKNSDKKDIWRWIKWGIGLLIPASLALGAYVYHFEYRDPFLEVHFYSLNKGRSILIRTPQNKTILVGGGQTSEIIREITKAIPFYKRKIDYVIVPSAVPAQIGGLVEILDRYEIREIVVPKILATSTALTALLQKIRTYKIHVEEVERGDVVDIEDRVKISVLFPYSAYVFNRSSLPELGFALSFDSTALYLLGNLSKTIQKDILKNSEIQKGENIVEFYNTAAEAKVSADLLKKIDPKFIFSTKEKTTFVVSSGKNWVKR